MALDLSSVRGQSVGRKVVLVNEVLFGIGATSVAALNNQVDTANGFGGLATVDDLAAYIRTILPPGLTKTQALTQAYTAAFGVPPPASFLAEQLARPFGVAGLLADFILNNALANNSVRDAVNGFVLNPVPNQSIFPPPTDIVDASDNDHTLNVIEHAVDGTTVGVVRAIDASAVDTHTFALAQPSALFDINAATGAITVKQGASAQLNAGSYVLNVTTTDSHNKSVTVAITVSVGVNNVLHNISVQPGQANNGTAGNDAFLVATTDLSSGTQIHGNGGSDALKVNGPGTTGAFVMDGVATVETHTLSGGNQIIDMSNVQNVSSLIIDNSTAASVRFINIQDEAGSQAAVLGPLADGLTVQDVSNVGLVQVDFDPIAAQGPADLINVKMGESAADANTVGRLAFTTLGAVIGGIEAAAFHNAGTTNIGRLSGGNDLKSLTLDGSGSFSLGAANPLLNENASLNNINLTGFAGISDINWFNGPKNAALPALTYVGGSGNDVLRIGDQIIPGTSLDGGAGTNDVLHVNTFNAIPLSPFAGITVKNFEKLIFDAPITGGTLDVGTMNAFGFNNHTKYDYTAVNNANITFTDFVHGGANNDILVKGVGTINLTLDGGPSVPFQHDFITVNDNTPTINLNAVNNVGAIDFHMLGAGTNRVVNVSGATQAGDLELIKVSDDAGGALNTVTFTDSGFATPALHTFDASATTHTAVNIGTNFATALVFDASHAGGVHITGGSSNDSFFVFLTGGNEAHINGGLGVDAVHLNSASYNATITAGEIASGNLSVAGLNIVGGVDSVDNFQVTGGGADKIHFANNVAGSAANYFEVVAAADEATMLNNVNSAMAALNKTFVAGNIGGDAYVFADTNGDHLADAAIKIIGQSVANAGFNENIITAAA